MAILTKSKCFTFPNYPSADHKYYNIDNVHYLSHQFGHTYTIIFTFYQNSNMTNIQPVSTNLFRKTLTVHN